MDCLWNIGIRSLFGIGKATGTHGVYHVYEATLYVFWRSGLYEWESEGTYDVMKELKELLLYLYSS